MGADAPQWLGGACADALEEIGVSADRAACMAEAHDLIGLWNAPGRSAHNFRHLIHVLTLIDELSDAAHDPDIVRVAAWYHGACLTREYAHSSGVADPSLTLPTCAELTRSRLAALGTPVEVIDRVVELLGYVASHRAPAGDSDAQVLVDADLGRLALSPQEFMKYRQCLRDEYSSLDDSSYCQARRRAIVDLLNRDSIFSTDQASEWEDVARSNLELELARIDDQMRQLCPSALISDENEDAVVEDSAAATSRSTAAPIPERDEDLISDHCVHAAPAKVIKRRSILGRSPQQMDDELVTTGILPTVSLIEDSDPSEVRRIDDTDTDLSSLESAVEALGDV